MDGYAQSSTVHGVSYVLDPDTPSIGKLINQYTTILVTVLSMELDSFLIGEINQINSLREEWEVKKVYVTRGDKGGTGGKGAWSKS